MKSLIHLKCRVNSVHRVMINTTLNIMMNAVTKQLLFDDDQAHFKAAVGWQPQINKFNSIQNLVRFELI